MSVLHRPRLSSWDILSIIHALIEATRRYVEAVENAPTRKANRVDFELAQKDLALVRRLLRYSSASVMTREVVDDLSVRMSRL